MLYFLVSDPIAPWGQAAAIVILIYLLVSILIGLALALGLMLGLTWVRQKAELIKMLRPTVNSVNTTADEAIKGTLPPPGPRDNKIVRKVAEIPAYAHTVEEKVEQGSDKVAGAVIEFRARTQMTKQIIKAFFLPGLTHPQPIALPQEKGVAFKSPGYRILVEEKAPGDELVGPGEGYAGSIKASQLKDAPVDVPASPPSSQ